MNERRTRTLQPPARPPCALCGRLRLFLALAAFILVMMWSQPEWTLPAGWDFSGYVGYLFLAGFVGLFGWKYYQYRKDPPEEEEPPPVRRYRGTRMPGDPRG